MSVELPEAVRGPRSLVFLAVAGALGLFLLLWVVIAVVVPSAEDAACAGVTFRAPVDDSKVSSDANPQIGGDGGFAGSVRKLFTNGQPVVYCHDFADPFVLRSGDSYEAYSTNTGEDHVPVLTSGGLFGTASRHDVLPDLPKWSAPGFVWAPSILQRGDRYVLYYTTRVASSGAQCISYALGDEPSGAFTDSSSGPFICPPDGGAIDPEPFLDSNGTAYLLWKNYNGQTGIMAQQLASDGTSLVGPTQLLAVADQGWEAGIVEAPTMLLANGTYYLFYSGNAWDTADYAIGYAVCSGPMGPCTKPNQTPWLTGTPTAQGPGSPSVFRDGKGDTWLALHSWVGGKVGYPEGARNLFVVRFTIDPQGRPVLTSE